jgi:hypothetical protein
MIRCCMSSYNNFSQAIEIPLQPRRAYYLYAAGLSLSCMLLIAVSAMAYWAAILLCLLAGVYGLRAVLAYKRIAKSYAGAVLRIGGVVNWSMLRAGRAAERVTPEPARCFLAKSLLVLSICDRDVFGSRYRLWLWRCELAPDSWRRLRVCLRFPQSGSLSRKMLH